MPSNNVLKKTDRRTPRSRSSRWKWATLKTDPKSCSADSSNSDSNTYDKHHVGGPLAFAEYIMRVLKQRHPSIEISEEAVVIVNQFLNIMLDKLAQEASTIGKSNEETVISYKEIELAVKSLIHSLSVDHAKSTGLVPPPRFAQLVSFFFDTG